MGFKLSGAREQLILKGGAVLIAFLIAGYWIYADHKKRSDAAFHGVVVEMYWRHSTKFGLQPEHLALAEDGTSGQAFSRRPPHYYIDVQTAKGVVDYEMNFGGQREVELGDYVVKYSGQEQLALFRNGEQLRLGGDFRTDTMVLPESISRLVAAPALPEAEGQVMLSIPPTPAPPNPAQDANIRGLMDQASQLWRAGEKDASIMASEKALMLTETAYGRKSAQYRDLEGKIAAAKRAMKL